MQPREAGVSHAGYVAKLYRSMFNVPFRNGEALKGKDDGFPLPKLDDDDTYTRRWLNATVTAEELLMIKEAFDKEMRSVSYKDNNEVLRGLKFERLWLRQEGKAYDLAKKHAAEQKEKREYLEYKQRIKERLQEEQARQQRMQRSQKEESDNAESEPEKQPEKNRLKRGIKEEEEDEQDEGEATNPHWTASEDEKGEEEGEEEEEVVQPPPVKRHATTASWRVTTGGPGATKKAPPPME